MSLVKLCGSHILFGETIPITVKPKFQVNYIKSVLEKLCYDIVSSNFSYYIYSSLEVSAISCSVVSCQLDEIISYTHILF